MVMVVGRTGVVIDGELEVGGTGAEDREGDGTKAATRACLDDLTWGGGLISEGQTILRGKSR